MKKNKIIEHVLHSKAYMVIVWGKIKILTACIAKKE